MKHVEYLRKQGMFLKLCLGSIRKRQIGDDEGDGNIILNVLNVGLREASY
jgi:hypothetical protein